MADPKDTKDPDVEIVNKFIESFRKKTEKKTPKQKAKIALGILDRMCVYTLDVAVENMREISQQCGRELNAHYLTHGMRTFVEGVLSPSLDRAVSGYLDEFINELDKKDGTS